MFSKSDNQRLSNVFELFIERNVYVRETIITLTGDQ